MIRLAVLVLAALAWPASTAAQWADAQLPRRGELQVGLTGTSVMADRRFRPDGSTQPLTDVLSAELDSRLVPALETLDARLADAFTSLGLSAPTASVIGTVRYDVLTERTSVPLGLAWGITRWLAVHASVPIVKGKSFTATVFDTLAAGAGPAATAFGGDPNGFLADVNEAISDLESLIQAGTLPPEDDAAARGLLADVQTMAAALDELSGLEYLPTDSSANGRALGQLYGELSGGFEDLGLALPPLELARPPSPSQAAELASGPEFGIRTPRNRDTGIKFGDIAIGLGVQPINTFPRRPGDPLRTVPIRARLDVLWRFPTGDAPAADRITDPGTGDEQADLELRSALDVGFGSRVWLSLYSSYNIQMETETRRLITAPDAPIQPGAFVGRVRWDPGDVLTVQAAPRFNLTDAITFSVVYAVVHRGRDRFVLLQASPPGSPFDAGDLERDSGFTARSAAFTARYSSTGWTGERRPGLPLEIEFRYRRRLGSSDGFVPQAHTLEFAARWYR